jgi:hypothetical protein
MQNIRQHASIKLLEFCNLKIEDQHRKSLLVKYKKYTVYIFYVDTVHKNNIDPQLYVTLTC